MGLQEEIDVRVTSVKVGRFAYTVTVGGEVDMYSAPEVRAALEAVPEDVRHLLVDLSQVTFIDSIGLATLVSAARRIDARGGRMMLVVDDARIRKLLAVTGIDRFFSIRSSDDDTTRELVGSSVLESLSRGGA